MQRPGKIIITLSAAALCLISIAVFFVLSYDTASEEPYDEPIVYDEEKSGLMDGDHAAHFSMDTNLDDESGKTEPDIYPGIYIREIPLPLDQNMEDHLADFRSKAKEIQEKYPNDILISMATREKKAALTFDDGPDGSSTLEIIKILNSYKVPGTFFFIGQQVDRHSEVVQAALAGGHVIANHSWSHLRPTDVNVEVLMDEICRTQKMLVRYGANQLLFRPPYGLVKEEHVPALAEAGFKTIVWSIDSMDWYFDNAESIVTCVVENIHPGAVILMHSSGGPKNRQAAIEALPMIIERLQRQGYTFVPIS